MGFNLPLLNRRRRIGGFNPRAILAGSTAIAWFDPSDLPTLYQDAAGTTPVTAPAQPVGLVLDKSQGLVLGPELVTNGDFSNGTTGWSATGSATLSVVSGRLRVENSTTITAGTTQLINTVAGRTYLWSYFVDPATSGGAVIRVRDGSTLTVISTATRTAVGTFSLYFVATSSTTQINCINSNSTVGAFLEVDNISVRELPGFHATQSTAANRPTYGVVPSRGRVNLLTYTEQFDNAVWTKGGGATISNTTTVGPLGTGFAQKLQEAATTNAFSISVAPGMALNTTHVFTVYMKAAERSFGILNIFTGSASCWTWYNLSSGTVGTVGAGATASMVSVGDGWYRCSISIATAASGTPNVGIWPANANGSISYAGTAGSGILIWGAQLELGTTASPYQRVVSQFEVTDPVGFPSYPLHYLFFGGDLDPRWLQTSTITPSADKVQVFAGVRKLSDATNTGLVAELSTDINSANGAFTVRAPSGTAGGQQLTFSSKGTMGSIAAGNGYAQPVSLVFTGLGDISGDLSTLRVNGTQVGQSTADQGTGNYLAYPLFIGRRFNNPPTVPSSLAFNGQLYGLIVRFSTANLDAGLLGQTEKWMGGKTPEMAAPIITGVPTIGVA